MREAQRVEHIGRLIEGIGLIGPGAVFERFGAKFLDHHLDAGLVHRGLNAQLNPVGGTVDSVDDAGRLAAEYSVEKDYFQGKWVKPTNDILHVVRKHPDVKDIYLLSSQSSTPGEIKAAKARVGAWPGFYDRTIHYYDARRIAEVIVDDMLLDAAAVSALIEHLPVLNRILNENRATLAVPPVDPRRVALKTVEEAIEARLSDTNPVLAISGLAGSGKSDAAAAYVASKRDRYQTPMWVEGADLSQVSDLTSKRLWRGGADLNVVGMLQSRRCLLVIDDLPPSIALNDLKALCGPGSHILVTRRETAAGDLSIPALSASEAREILDRDVPDPCPKQVLDALMKAVGGHPLSFALINKAVTTGVSWNDIGNDCDSIAELDDGRERLADRVLGRLKPLLATELSVFAWAGQSTCDHRFLKSVIRTPGMIKIGGQGLRAADRPSIVRLHDVVYASLRVQNWLLSERAVTLDKLLEDHVAALITEESLALRVLATTMRSKLEAIVATRFSPAALVALLSVWRSEELNPRAVGLPETHLANLEERHIPASYLEIRFILEAIEGLYRHEKDMSIETAKANLSERLPLFERLLAIKATDPLSYAEIRHHWGKALKFLGRVEEALTQFEAVLAGANPLNATRLQLVRLYAKDDDRAVVLADEILTAAQKPLAVVGSIVLGVVEDLSWARGPSLHALFDKHADLIEREIVVAAEAGLEQAYDALASVGRYWSWHDPTKLATILSAIPVPSVDMADDRTSGALGEILLKLAKSKYPPDRELQERAVRYYRSIAVPDDFQLQKYGEVLIDLKRFSEAEAVLRRISRLDSDAFASYRLSQARLAQGDTEEALTLIDAALGGLEEGKQKFAAAFWAHRFKIRQAQADPHALDDLDNAIAACEPGKYRTYLQDLRKKES
jgi:tetratricopeptide (TPR) repeat protein